jgi:hypothetical protein
VDHAPVAVMSGDQWPTVSWGMLAVGVVVLMIWFWLRDQRR